MLSYGIAATLLFSAALLNFSQALVAVQRPALSVQKADSDTLHTSITRPDFIDFLTRGVTASVLLLPTVSSARGRATLEQSYDRYSPRIIAGGAFYKNELKKAIDKNDWASLKVGSSPTVLQLVYTCLFLQPFISLFVFV